MKAQFLRVSSVSLCCCVVAGAYIAVLWVCRVVLQ